MGFALASAAKAMGAKVCVVSGPTTATPGVGVECIRVQTAAQMMRETLKRSPRAAIVVGAAAVLDWRFQRVSDQKIKRGRGPLRLTLVPNPDIIKTAASRRHRGQIFVGFALETRRVVRNARLKLAKKSLDLVVANDPRNLGSNRARVTLVTQDRARPIPEGSKMRVARSIIAEAVKLLESRN